MNYPFGRFRTWLLLRLLGQYAAALGEQGKTEAENATLDLMDSVAGRCHSNWRLS